jgi:hypothetical protein
MDIEQAFKVLGLSPNSSLDEISQAYHKKSLDLHPDVAGGDQKEQVELNQAHEMAEAYAKIRNAVIPISTNDLILRITRALSIPQYLETAETMGRRIAKKKTQSLQLVKQFSWIIGSISAFVAFFWKDLLPITSLDKVAPELDSALKIIAVMFGLMGLISQFRQNSQGQATETRYFFPPLEQIEDGGDVDEFDHFRHGGTRRG